MPFSGSFSSIPLPYVLQTLKWAGLSGTLLLFTETRQARLYFRHGALIDAGISARAVCGIATGEFRAYTPGISEPAAQAERLMKMASIISRLDVGHFNFITSPEPDTLSPLALDIEAVLLDALRSEDEARRERPAA